MKPVLKLWKMQLVHNVSGKTETAVRRTHPLTTINSDNPAKTLFETRKGKEEIPPASQKIR